MLADAFALGCAVIVGVLALAFSARFILGWARSLFPNEHIVRTTLLNEPIEDVRLLRAIARIELADWLTPRPPRDPRLAARIRAQYPKARP